MANLTLTYAFPSDSQGWVGANTGGSSSTATWQSSGGNSGGCLGFTLATNGSITWTISGTWESFGIPSGATVTQVQLSSIDSKITAIGAGSTLAIGPCSLKNSSNVFIAGSLYDGRTGTTVEGSWTTSGGALQTISGSDGVSTNSVKFIIAANVFSGSATGTALLDNIVISINYTPAPPPTRTGAAPLVHGHQTLTSSGTFTYPRYKAAAPLTQTKQTLTSAGLFISRIYTASAPLVHSHETLIAQGTFTKPKYTGSAALVHSHEVLVAQGVSRPPKYFAAASLPQSHQSLAAQGRFFRLARSGLNLFIKGVPAPSFTPIHDTIPLYIYGDATTSQSRPHGSAGFIFNSLNLYINGISRGITNGTGSLNLYINGISQFLANQITLYLCNNTNLIGKSTTLYIRGDGLNPGFTPIHSSLNMFVQGTGSNIVFPSEASNSIPLFINGTISSANYVANATTLFIKVVEGNLISNNITLFISGKNIGVANNSITLVIPRTKLENTIPLYIHGF